MLNSKTCRLSHKNLPEKICQVCFYTWKMSSNFRHNVPSVIVSYSSLCRRSTWTTSQLFITQNRTDHIHYIHRVEVNEWVSRAIILMFKFMLLFVIITMTFCCFIVGKSDELSFFEFPLNIACIDPILNRIRIYFNSIIRFTSNKRKNYRFIVKL